MTGTVFAQTDVIQAGPAQVSGWNSDRKEVIVLPSKADKSENDTQIAEAAISPETITSVDDFEVFARNIINQDPNIKLIKLTSGLNEISYRYPGKFLGIIPVRARVKAFIGNDYRAKVKFPWYHIFIKKTVDLTLSEKESDLSKFQFPGLQNELQKQAWSLQLLSNILRNKHL